MVALFAAVFLVAGAGIFLYAQSSREQAEIRDFASCNRGNQLKGYLINRSFELPKTSTGTQAPDLFPILDCSPIEDGDPPHPMTAIEQEVYLQQLGAGIIPKESN